MARRLLLLIPLILLGASFGAILPKPERARALQDETFNATCGAGIEQTFNVPAGVTRMRVTVSGAPGAPGIQEIDRAPGGGGSSAAATFDVTPGQTFYLELGCQGAGTSD